MSINLTPSQILDQIRSDGLDKSRGLRWIEGRLITRDHDQGRDWNQIGRIIDQTNAVELFARSIDRELGRPGEGRKLLKEMGGVYRMIGARITPEQIEKAISLAEEKKEQARIRAGALSGKLIEFSLLPGEQEKTCQTISQDFENAPRLRPDFLDKEFEKDGYRGDLWLLAEGRDPRDVRSEIRQCNFGDDEEHKRAEFARNALLDFVREEGDDQKTVFQKALHLSALINQRVIGTVFEHVKDLLEGFPVGSDDLDYVVHKWQDDAGVLRYRVAVVSAKPYLRLFSEDKGKSSRDVPLVKGESYFSQVQTFEISSNDLAQGNGKGLIVHPPEVTVKMVEDKAAA